MSILTKNNIYIAHKKKKNVKSMWCTTRKPKGSSNTRSLTKLFERIFYRSINSIVVVKLVEVSLLQSKKPMAQLPKDNVPTNF